MVLNREKVTVVRLPATALSLLFLHLNASDYATSQLEFQCNGRIMLASAKKADPMGYEKEICANFIVLIISNPITTHISA